MTRGLTPWTGMAGLKSELDRWFDQEKEAKDERYHRVERSYGVFTRSARLPVGVDASRASAAFKNGLLTVTMPKTPAAKGTTIPIKDE